MALSRKVVRGILSLREKGFNPEGILDIGSYIGEFGLTMRNNFKSSHILMVDPLDEQVKVCTHIADRIGNAEFKQALLGADESEKEFHLVDTTQNPNLNLSGSSVYKENNKFPFTSRKIKQTTLEKLLENDSNKYDFVKISAQGAEVDILLGAGSRLKDIEVVVMKMNLLDYNDGAPLMADVLHEMDLMGFVLYDILEEHRMNTPELFQVDGMFLRKDSKYRLHPPFFAAG